MRNFVAERVSPCEAVDSGVRIFASDVLWVTHCPAAGAEVDGCVCTAPWSTPSLPVGASGHVARARGDKTIARSGLLLPHRVITPRTARRAQ